MGYKWYVQKKELLLGAPTVGAVAQEGPASPYTMVIDLIYKARLLAVNEICTFPVNGVASTLPPLSPPPVV